MNKRAYNKIVFVERNRYRRGCNMKKEKIEAMKEKIKEKFRKGREWIGANKRKSVIAIVLLCLILFAGSMYGISMYRPAAAENKDGYTIAKANGDTADSTNAAINTEDVEKSDTEDQKKADQDSSKKKEDTKTENKDEKQTTEKAKVSQSSKQKNESSNSGGNTGSSSSSSSSSNAASSGGSSSSSSSQQKPTHTHNWQPTYTTEKKWVDTSWDETVSEPVYEYEDRAICNTCGADITGGVDDHIYNHMVNGENGSYRVETVQVQTGTNTYTIHHDEGHWEESKKQSGYKCSCGATK